MRRRDGELKRRPGPPKGTPKIPGSGNGAVQRKGLPKIGKEAREWLAARSNVLDLYARVVAGKRIRVMGPTGKQMWYTPTWAERKAMASEVLARTVPALGQTQLTGEDGGPVQVFGLVDFLKRLPE